CSGGEEAGVGVVADDRADAVREVADPGAAAGTAAHGAGRAPLAGGVRVVGRAGVLLGDAVAVGEFLAGVLGQVLARRVAAGPRVAELELDGVARPVE